MRAHIKIFMLAIILLASSCGIFKKSTKTDHRTEVAIEVDSTTKTTIEEKSDFIGILDEEVGTLTIIMADQIKINQDGSIQADGHATAEQSKVEKRKSEKSGNSEKVTTVDSDYSETAKAVVKDSERVSVPDQKVLGKLIGWVVGAAVLVFFVIWGLNKIRGR